MHDSILVTSIINNVKNKESVNTISLELGDLSNITKEHLKETLQKLTGWKVNISLKQSRVKCSCGYIGKAKIKERLHDLVIFNCPKCNELPEVLEGKDIKITSITYN